MQIRIIFLEDLDMEKMYETIGFAMVVLKMLVMVTCVLSPIAGIVFFALGNEVIADILFKVFIGLIIPSIAIYLFDN